MASSNLSKRQRQILLLMRENGVARFATSQMRRFYWRVTEMGVVICAYQQPEYFLSGRKLIAKVEQSNMPGTWYRLTPDGERRAASLVGSA